MAEELSPEKPGRRKAGPVKKAMRRAYRLAVPVALTLAATGLALQKAEIREAEQARKALASRVGEALRHNADLSRQLGEHRGEAPLIQRAMAESAALHRVLGKALDLSTARHEARDLMLTMARRSLTQQELLRAGVVLGLLHAVTEVHNQAPPGSAAGQAAQQASEALTRFRSALKKHGLLYGLHSLPPETGF